MISGTREEKKKATLLPPVKVTRPLSLMKRSQEQQPSFFYVIYCENVATFFVPPVNSFQIILIYTVSASVQIIVIKSVCVV